ncbi:MAG: hypothetical protein AAGI38_03750 [Bacteroidota bacterium]
MKAKWKKFAVRLALTTMVMVFGLIALLLNPNVMFAHAVTHGKFIVYANTPLDEATLAPFLDGAIQRVEGCELYDDGYHYKIILAHNSFYNKIDNLIFDPYAAARPTANNIIVKAPVDLEAKVALTDRSRIDLTYLLSHEMIHCLQANSYGMAKFNPFSPPPMWKLEGYPEYISRPELHNKGQDQLREQISQYLKWEASLNDGWIQVSDNHHLPGIYVKGRLMTTYLMEVKEMTYDDLLKEQVKEEEVYQAMLSWAATTDP